ncbi:putative quinol monooxygenase [Streptomyces griseoluteus]|jgi:quinol monooxygenase YgiN|uniref:putative quinol monooxygenase n=1 Tax=Streptomyces TaxID=1883 RepID=UPI000A385B8D|nr:antibiotic biosynthesis monooxygenase family protein [Streptomyces recifensis]
MAQPKNRETPTQIVYSTYYRVHPEDRQKFVDAVVPHLEYTAALPGCVFYVFAADLLDPNVIHLSEGWEDQAALDRHNTSEPFLKALREVTENVRILDRQGQKYAIASQGAGDPPGGTEAFNLDRDD